jgi:hypothetical protein
MEGWIVHPCVLHEFELSSQIAAEADEMQSALLVRGGWQLGRGGRDRITVFTAPPK